jgi:hypothetical protein
MRQNSGFALAIKAEFLTPTGHSGGGWENEEAHQAYADNSGAGSEDHYLHEGFGNQIATFNNALHGDDSTWDSRTTLTSGAARQRRYPALIRHHRPRHRRKH